MCDFSLFNVVLSEHESRNLADGFDVVGCVAEPYLCGLPPTVVEWFQLPLQILAVHHARCAEMRLQLNDHLGFGDWYLVGGGELLTVLHALVVCVDWAGEIRCLLEFLFVGNDEVVVELGIIGENMGEEVIHRKSVVAEKSRVELEVIVLGDGLEELILQ